MRIAQLSDLHLTAAEGARTWGAAPWRSLRRVLDDLGRASPRPDLLVLTGDLASRRRPATYERLRDWLLPWRDRLCVIPGNHDHRQLLRSAFADRILPDRPTVQFARELGGWRLLGLDSLRPPWVHGRLGRGQLAWLEEQLARDARPAFLFVHHPPVRVHCWWLDKDRLRDRCALAEVVRGRSVRAIACGHVHQAAVGTLAGVPVWTCPSTAYQFRPRGLVPGPISFEPAYRLFDLDGEGVASTVVRLPAETGRLG